jgi:hypothetical protein
LWIVVAVVGVLVALQYLAPNGGYDEIDTSTMVKHIDDGSVQVTFQVVRQQPQRPAVCIIRARSEDGDETGRKEVFIPPGGGSVLETTVLRTSRRPVTGEVYGCSYDVPAYLTPAPG